MSQVIKDAWILIDADGYECGRGDGPPGRIGHDERIIWVDGRDALDKHALVQASQAREAAQRQRIEARASSYTLKTITARAFLREVPEHDEPADQDTINAEQYPELYDEYWATWHQRDWSPWELARRIAQNASEASTREARKRETRLDAKQVLAIPLPTIDSENDT